MIVKADLPQLEIPKVDSCESLAVQALNELFELADGAVFSNLDREGVFEVLSRNQAEEVQLVVVHVVIVASVLISWFITPPPLQSLVAS